MDTALFNARVLTDDGFATDKAVIVRDGAIAAIVDAGAIPTNAARRDLGGGVLLPGFIDTQVNGGGGAMFSDAPTVDAIATIGAAHRQYGTTGFLPTLISGDLDVVAQAIDSVDRAVAAGAPGVLGIHIEGPFLNVERKGIHDASKFRVIDEAAFALLTSLKHGKTIVTLAPETTNPRMIARLAEAGVAVCAGHTNGAYATIRAALDHGLSGFTHLFNAMSEGARAGRCRRRAGRRRQLVRGDRRWPPRRSGDAAHRPARQAPRPLHVRHRRHALRRHGR